MKRTIIISVLLVLSVSAFSAGKTPKVRMTYDVDFAMDFDNREFYRSDFSKSMTIFAASLTPSVGLALDEKNGSSHRLMAGVELMKDFGAGDSPSDNFEEIVVYYKLEKPIGKTKLDIYAGVFPRYALEADWSPAFFSDSLNFYDAYLEGILLKFHRPKAYFEVGCDWMGQYGETRREKFMIFSAGHGKVFPFMTLGYSAYMLHYANSGISKGLVDNVLLNPYMSFDVGYLADMQKLSFRVGWLQAMQRDREYDGVFVYPGGLEFDQEIRKWNVGIHNRFFYGKNMMPYYNNFDNAGLKYGNTLYFGDPFYRLHDDGKMGNGVYDRLEVYYEPYIGDYLELRVSALFHFHNSGYSGCQQMVTLGFNLSNLMAHVIK